MDNTNDKKTIPMKKKNRKKPDQRKELKKSRLRRVLFILFALLYFPALWNWMFHGSITTAILHSGLLEMNVPVEGVFIRSEVTLQAPQDGILIPMVNQGDRVPKDYDLAKIIDTNSQYILQRIDNMERDIIRQTADESPHVLDGDSHFNEKIQNEVNKLTEVAMDKNLLSAKTVRSSLEQLLHQRNKEIFEKQDDRLYLQKDKQELEQLQKALDDNAINISAEFSGVVVWDTAPYEQRYDVDNMNQLDMEDLTIKKERNSDFLQSPGIGDSFPVKKEQNYARLVNNEKSWYVCVIDNKYKEQIKQGSLLMMKVDGLQTPIQCQVESIQPFEGKLKVILSFNRMIEETIHLRHAQAALVLNRIQGIKIPLRSLTNINPYDNTADIIIVRFDRATVKRVKILAQQDTFAIIDTIPDANETNPVRIFDVYVVNPQNIVEGQVIE